MKTWIILIVTMSIIVGLLISEQKKEEQERIKCAALLDQVGEKKLKEITSAEKKQLQKCAENGYYGKLEDDSGIGLELGVALGINPAYWSLLE